MVIYQQQKPLQHDCVDILCSDYYPAALLHAIFDFMKSTTMIYIRCS